MAAPMNAGWWARGLIFENCNCQLICPGHVHFEQQCTHDRCRGYWAVVVAAGRYGDVDLAGVRAVVAYDSPQRMIDGGWTQVILVDESASAEQRAGIEAILEGRAGGPWGKLAPFVGERLPTRYVPIDVVDNGKEKSISVEGVLEGRVQAIRGRDRAGVVTFENMFNQIHPSTQVIARGTMRYDDGTIAVASQNTHGLYSEFDWSVSGA